MHSLHWHQAPDAPNAPNAPGHAPAPNFRLGRKFLQTHRFSENMWKPTCHPCETNQLLGLLPSGYVKIAIENGPVEIVDFPSYKMVDLSIAMLVITRG